MSTDTYYPKYGARRRTDSEGVSKKAVKRNDDQYKDRTALLIQMGGCFEERFVDVLDD